MTKRNQRTRRNGNPRTQRNGKAGTKRNGRAGVSVHNTYAVSSGALEGASMFGETRMRDGAGKPTLRDARETAQNAGQSALAIAKRNPVSLALAVGGVACAGLGLALWLSGDRAAFKGAMRSISRSIGKGLAQPG